MQNATCERRPGIEFVIAAVKREHPGWPQWRVLSEAKERYARPQQPRGNT